jgi:hypothetical protein
LGMLIFVIDRSQCAKDPSPIYDAFTELHLGQFLAFFKCILMNRRDGGIDPNTDYILRNIVSARPCVDEVVGIGPTPAHILRLEDAGEATARPCLEYRSEKNLRQKR